MTDVVGAFYGKESSPTPTNCLNYTLFCPVQINMVSFQFNPLCMFDLLCLIFGLISVVRLQLMMEQNTSMSEFSAPCLVEVTFSSIVTKKTRRLKRTLLTSEMF